MREFDGLLHLVVEAWRPASHGAALPSLLWAALPLLLWAVMHNSPGKTGPVSPSSRPILGERDGYGLV
jgi:hypothetical protein